MKNLEVSMAQLAKERPVVREELLLACAQALTMAERAHVLGRLLERSNRSVFAVLMNGLKFSIEVAFDDTIELLNSKVALSTGIAVSQQQLFTGGNEEPMVDADVCALVTGAQIFVLPGANTLHWDSESLEQTESKVCDGGVAVARSATKWSRVRSVEELDPDYHEFSVTLLLGTGMCCIGVCLPTYTMETKSGPSGTPGATMYRSDKQFFQNGKFFSNWGESFRGPCTIGVRVWARKGQIQFYNFCKSTTGELVNNETKPLGLAQEWAEQCRDDTTINRKVNQQEGEATTDADGGAPPPLHAVMCLTAGADAEDCPTAKFEHFAAKLQ